MPRSGGRETLPSPRLTQPTPPHPTPPHPLLPAAAQVTQPNLQTKALIAAGIDLMRPPGARGPARHPNTGLARHLCLHVRLGDFSKVREPPSCRAALPCHVPRRGA